MKAAACCVLALACCAMPCTSQPSLTRALSASRITPTPTEMASTSNPTAKATANTFAITIIVMSNYRASLSMAG